MSQEMEQTEKSKSEALASMEKALDAQRIESDKLGQGWRSTVNSPMRWGIMIRVPADAPKTHTPSAP